MNRDELRRRLEELYRRYDHRFVPPDPLEYVRAQAGGADREVVGLVASGLAFGTVSQIKRSIATVLESLLVQILPLPASLLESLGAPGAPAREAIAPFVREAAPTWSPWSLSPADTVDALARFAGYVALGFACVVGFREPRHIFPLAVTLVLSGVLQAVYGGGEYLSGSNRILGFEKKHYLDCATGTFVNRNHFAGYLAAVLPFAFALAARARSLADARDPFRARAAAWGWTPAAGLLAAQRSRRLVPRSQGHVEVAPLGTAKPQLATVLPWIEDAAHQ